MAGKTQAADWGRRNFAGKARPAAVLGNRRKFHPPAIAENGLRMRPARPSALGGTGLQSERMQLAAHFGLERFVDDLVLLNPGLTAKRFGDDGCRVMVAVAGEVADGHRGVRNARPDQSFDVTRSHGHLASHLARKIYAVLRPQCGDARVGVNAPPRLKRRPPYRPVASLRSAS